MPQTPIRPLPSATYLRECFDYNPETGTLVWRARPRQHFMNDRAFIRYHGEFPGKDAGCRWANRITVRVGGSNARIGRVIWKLMTGIDPGKYVDHIDRNPFNNRWDNLREATRVQNRRNCNNIRGRELPKGVHRHGNRFRARIVVNRKHTHLGLFGTPEEAHAAYVEAARKADPDFFSAG